MVRLELHSGGEVDFRIGGVDGGVTLRLLLKGGPPSPYHLSLVRYPVAPVPPHASDLKIGVEEPEYRVRERNNQTREMKFFLLILEV
ncbi:unnamed protein product [Linum trigynum]|uniref:Uncharacterized protein n=1 Tax=Linum trigynum TaxID=586398 RepID=A0AAV2GSP8_9ROSI